LGKSTLLEMLSWLSCMLQVVSKSRIIFKLLPRLRFML
jgi:hypothetical protein